MYAARCDELRRGPAMPQRMALAPRPNLQRHDDRHHPDDEFRLAGEAGGRRFRTWGDDRAASTHALGKGFQTRRLFRQWPYTGLKDVLQPCGAERAVSVRLTTCRRQCPRESDSPASPSGRSTMRAWCQRALDRRGRTAIEDLHPLRAARRECRFSNGVGARRAGYIRPVLDKHNGPHRSLGRQRGIVAA